MNIDYKFNKNVAILWNTMLQTNFSYFSVFIWDIQMTGCYKDIKNFPKKFWQKRNFVNFC